MRFLGPSPHHAKGIWFLSENVPNVFHPHQAGEI